MKKAILVFLVSCTVSVLSAQNERQEPFLTKSLPGESIKQVEVETSGGNISVESSAADKSRVDVFIWPSSGRNKGEVSKETLQKRLDELYDLKITVSGDKLTAIAKSKVKIRDWKNALSISFKVYVGKDVSTHLTTSGGNIDLRAITGEQEITTSGGNLNIDGVKGKMKGTTSGGNIDVKDSDNKMDLTTSGGNINANHCSGGIKLTTSGGSIRVVDLNGNVDATTSGGDVRGNNIQGDLEAHTSGGNIDLAGLACNLATGTSGGDIKVVIREPGKFIKIRNSGGKIELELPAGKGYDLDLSADKIQTGKLSAFNGKVEDDQVDGTLNGGGTKVTANASGGKIVLTVK
ncbi:MAG: hypothetical protein JWP81_3925 [Ferruginibacter sp.]|nr:hypothetical protein [Ferruginibacter sp.]